MNGAKVFGVVTLFIAGVALADLIAHPKGTKVLTSSAVTVQKQGVNGLLGKTS